MNLRLSVPSTAIVMRLLAPPLPCAAYRSFLQSRLCPNVATPCINERIKSCAFSTTTKRSAEQNHYQVLGVPPDCTKAELKKHFYTLSKETHPDRHRNNPDAGKRFAQISESYSILSDPEKRRKYDRDHVRAHHGHGRTGGPGHRGSFAGSRPANGLSKRRGAFRGPPPSFYAHGNPSASTARQASGSQTSDTSSTQSGTFDPLRYANPGQYDTDWDSASTYRTQSQEDVRRQTRRQAEMERIQKEMEADDGAFWARFLVVTGIIIIGVTVGTLISGAGGAKGGLVRGDGSRRDGGTRNDWAKG